MFVSFFPRPRVFLISILIWTALAMALWFGYAKDLFGASEPDIIGVGAFWSTKAIWFDLYFWACAALFAGGWMVIEPHPWSLWSILGSALILFTTYFQVQVSVTINGWFGPFYDLIQAALSKTKVVTIQEFNGYLVTFLSIALVAVVVGTLARFFIQHYIFRWRTAMNNYYVANWQQLRKIEGASQRVQEDTMRFATTLEGLGANFIDAILTLIAFLPVLAKLSSNITELPIVGAVPYPLVFAAVIWSLAGTGALALIGIKLPGIEFHNQRVEAAYRKELVYGEDDPARADPPKLNELFSYVRGNYFWFYWNYLYFNVGRIVYLQTDAIVPYFLLAPTIVAGAITLGPMNQIIRAFQQVKSSFQYLVNSWSTIIDLLSIYKRLRSFEATIYNEPMPVIETEAPRASPKAT
jgi:peptide/bleomycin uptake transporter